MLKQTVDSTDFDNPLLANGKWTEVGTYPEFIYKGERNRNLEINFEFTLNPDAKGIPEHIIESKDRKNKQKIKFRVVLYYNQKTTQIQLINSEINLNGTIRASITRSTNRKYSATVNWLNDEKLVNWNQHNVKPMKFYGFVAPLKKGEKSNRNWFEMFVYRMVIEREFSNLFYLGPLRQFPQRIYVASGQAPKDVESRGQRAVDVLWFAHRSSQGDTKNIEHEVRNWFNKFAIAKDIKLDRIGKGSNYYRLVITDPATGTEVNFVDIGFGASQTLPIIIQSFYAPDDSILLIEQPEIHLHPKAQSILGDLFIKAVNDADRTFIIETHSEHILARVRRRIAEKKIDKERVAIYYFEATNDGTIIKEVTLNEKGQYVDFPEGFFEEDLNEAFEHLKAMNSL